MTLETALRSMAKPVVVFGAAAYLTLSAIACAGVPLPPGQFRREDGQGQRYQQDSNSPGLPEISQPTPAPTAIVMPEPTAEPSPVPTYPVPTATQQPTPLPRSALWPVLVVLRHYDRSYQ